MAAFEHAVDEARRPIEHGLDRVLTRGHVAQLLLDRAERGDRLAKLLALPGIARRLLDRQPRAAAAHGAELQPPVVQRVECDLVTLPDLAEQVRGRDLRLLQDQRRRRGAEQPELVLFLAGRDAGEGALDDESREVLAIDLGKHDEDVGEAAVGDPHLLAVQHEAAVRLLPGCGLGAERVRS